MQTEVMSCPLTLSPPLLFVTFLFSTSQANGNWHGRHSPPPGASPHSDHSDNSDWWPRPSGTETTATESLMTEKKRQKRMTSHFPLGCSCFCTLFVWFDYFKCTLFLFLFPFSYCSALVIIMLVWLAECTDARVEMYVCVCACVCCVHAGVVLLSGVVGFVFHYFWHVTEVCLWSGEWEGGVTALSRFLAHYIIIIINIIAVLLLVLQLFSF